MNLSSRKKLLKEADIELLNIRRSIKMNINESFFDSDLFAQLVAFLPMALGLAWYFSGTTRSKIEKFDSLTGLDKIGDKYFDETEFNVEWLRDIWENIKRDLLINQELKTKRIELQSLLIRIRNSARVLIPDMESVSNELNIPIEKLKDMEYLLKMSKKIKDTSKRRRIENMIKDIKNYSSKLDTGFKDLELIIKPILMNSGLKDFDKLFRMNVRYTDEEDYNKNKQAYLNYLIKRATNFFQNEVKPMESNMKDKLVSKLPPEHRKWVTTWFGTIGGKRLF